MGGEPAGRDRLEDRSGDQQRRRHDRGSARPRRDRARRLGVWVATADAKVARIDTRAGRIASAVELDNPPAALAADGGSLWVATESTAAHHRGGTVIVGAEEFPYAYLEPGAYEPQA